LQVLKVSFVELVYLLQEREEKEVARKRDEIWKVVGVE
jgi:hypothetical protein